MEDPVVVTYTLVYHFLKQQSQDRVAKALQKAAKTIVALGDDIEPKGPPLEEIIKEWKAKQNNKPEDANSSSEDSESSDDTSSDEEDGTDSDTSSGDTSGSESDDTSDGSDSSDESDKESKVKPLPKKRPERDTSTTLSSAGDNVREVAKQVVDIPEKALKGKEMDSESDNSDSDSSGSDSSSKSSASDGSDAETSSSASDSSDSSDSSGEDEENEGKEAPVSAVKVTKEDTSSSSSESSSDDDESDPGPQQDVHVAKKRKTSESGAAVSTVVSTRSQENTSAFQKKEKSPSVTKERFQRIKVQNMASEQLLDNGYKARGGATNDYGERAHRDLAVTRGAGFRKEKNKKKRGSYRGGEITMENYSIKFDF